MAFTCGGFLASPALFTRGASFLMFSLELLLDGEEVSIVFSACAFNLADTDSTNCSFPFNLRAFLPCRWNEFLDVLIGDRVLGSGLLRKAIVGLASGSKHDSIRPGLPLLFDLPLLMADRLM